MFFLLMRTFKNIYVVTINIQYGVLKLFVFSCAGSCCGAWAVEHGPSCPALCPPGPGWLSAPVLASGFLTTGPPGSSHNAVLTVHYYICGHFFCNGKFVPLTPSPSFLSVHVHCGGLTDREKGQQGSVQCLPSTWTSDESIHIKLTSLSKQTYFLWFPFLQNIKSAPWHY